MGGGACVNFHFPLIGIPVDLIQNFFFSLSVDFLLSSKFFFVFPLVVSFFFHL